MIKQISIYTENRKGALRTLVRTLADAGVALRELSLNTISLEDYYLGVTKGGEHNG